MGASSSAVTASRGTTPLPGTLATTPSAGSRPSGGLRCFSCGEIRHRQSGDSVVYDSPPIFNEDPHVTEEHWNAATTSPNAARVRHWIPPGHLRPCLDNSTYLPFLHFRLRLAFPGDGGAPANSLPPPIGPHYRRLPLILLHLAESEKLVTSRPSLVQAGLRLSFWSDGCCW
ncbi:envelope glycoprotein gp160 [Striga asiatica]|uniref:Envelope glycoprotein gp160 n=1 Tax=Striga asiatica TaxID=4170 RepID=A0A5A7QXJ9_STRAF|nr:envelope glycoprotein gp160 [Striga asiatica]